MLAPNYVFPSLKDDSHIMGPMNEITHAFDHLSTQLSLVGLRVKVRKCKFCNPSGISPGIEIPHGCTLVTDGLRILGVPMGPQDFATHLLDETLSLNMVHIDDLLFLGDAYIASSIFIPMCSSLTFLSHTNSTSFLLISFNKFQQKSYASFLRHYGSKIVGVFLRPLNKASGSTTNIL